MGAGLEPKKKYGKPFRRDPAATEIQIQLFYHLVWPPTQKGEQPFNKAIEKIFHKL
jgi:hypothetical protein